MRGVAAVFVLVPLLLAASPPPPAPSGDVATALATVAALHGHWTCSTASGTPVTRSYASPVRANDRVDTAVYGRAESTQNGLPVTSYERIAADHDVTTVHIESVDGSATLETAAPTEVRFRGKAFNGAALALVYAFDGTTMQRTADVGGKRVADERCSRQPDAPTPANCPQPNVPATVLHGVEPVPSALASVDRVTGTVVIFLVLDDRSQVMWTSVARSPSLLLDQSSIDAARASTYRTEVRNCKPIASGYVFGVSYATR
jgi:hypothetical protein